MLHALESTSHSYLLSVLQLIPSKGQFFSCAFLLYPCCYLFANTSPLSRCCNFLTVTCQNHKKCCTRPQGNSWWPWEGLLCNCHFKEETLRIFGCMKETKVRILMKIVLAQVLSLWQRHDPLRIAKTWSFIVQLASSYNLGSEHIDRTLDLANLDGNLALMELQKIYGVTG